MTSLSGKAILAFPLVDGNVEIDDWIGFDGFVLVVSEALDGAELLKVGLCYM